MKKLIFSFLLLVLVGVAGAFAWYESQVHISLQYDGIIEIEKGEGFFKALRKIHSKSPISLRAAKLYLKKNKMEQSLKPGEYSIQTGDLLSSILKKMATGQVVVYKITVPEGYNLFEIGALLETNGIVRSKSKFVEKALRGNLFQDLVPRKIKSIEGYLFPATYEFAKNMKPENVIQTMVQTHLNNFNEVLTEFSMPEGYSRHQIVTLASVVEKETGASWERPLIASVFWNRLSKRMRLQSDPTTIYGQWVKIGHRLHNIRKKHLLEKNDYNTYKISRLPIGAIANPGRMAIEAVLNPKTSKFLYFVSKNDGTHYFSKTYAEHNQAVRKFQMSRRARAGKSWRDLKAKEK